MSNFKDIFQGSEIIEDKFYVSDTELFRLSAGKLFTTYEIWTGEGKTGTQLGEGTDFIVGGKSDRATQIKGVNVWRGFQILEPTFHNTVLYATITWVGTLGNTQTIKPPTDDYGDPIQENDILFNDGVNPMSSEGAQPLVDTSKKVPSFLEVNGQRYANQQVINPGKRHCSYIGEELENLIVNGNDAGSWTGTNATPSNSSGWVKVTQTSVGGLIFVTGNVAATGTFQLLYSAVLRWDDTTITDARFGRSGQYFDINVATKDITAVGTASLLNEQWLGDDTLVIQFGFTGVATNDFLFYPSVAGSLSVGYIQSPLAIDFGSTTPYPVPYFEGVKPAGSLDYSFPMQSGITLQAPERHGWTPGDGKFHTLFDTRPIDNPSDVANSIIARVDNLGNFEFYMHNAAGTPFLWETGSVASELAPGKHDIKVNVDSVTEANTRLFVDGVEIVFTTVPTLSGTFNLEEKSVLSIGHVAKSAEWNGFIGPVLYRPSIDTSDTHYQLGEPWIDSRASYTEWGDKTGPFGDEGKTSIYAISGGFVKGSRYLYLSPSNTGWQSQTISINHNLSGSYLITKVEIRNSNTGNNWQELKAVTLNSANWGYAIVENSPNALALVTGSSGIVYLNTSTGATATLVNGQIADLRVTVTNLEIFK